MISLQSVTKKYKSKKRKVSALSNVDLNFPDNGLYFIVGESGAGKSTLLNILTLQETPTSGKYFVDNLDTSTLKSYELDFLRSSYFGIVFQNLNLINDFTVFQNISLALDIQGKSIEESTIVSTLKQLNLSEEILYEKVENLSGGQKQRIAIARALLKNPNVIVCDEPTGSVDEKNAIEIMEILKLISKDKLVIVVSHNLYLSEKYADKIITISEGEISNKDQETKEQKTNHITHDKSFIKKTRMPLKASFRLCGRTFKRSFLRFFFTLISFFITISVFMISSTIYTYNPKTSLEKIMQVENVDYFCIVKNSKQNGTYDGFTYKDEEKIQEVYGNDIVYAYKQSDVGQAFVHNKTKESTSNLYFTNMISYINEDFINSTSMTLIGRLPVDQEYTNEIMLTNSLCYELGWISYENMNDESKLKEIIDTKEYVMTLSIPSEGRRVEALLKFDIVGILNTDKIFLESDEGWTSYVQSTIDRFEMHHNLFFSFEGYSYLKSIDNEYIGYESNNVYVLTKNNNYSKFESLENRFVEIYADIDAISRIDYIIQQCLDMKDAYGPLSLVLSGILFVISFFSFIGFIHNSIKINIGTMNILRTLGIRKSNATMIYLIQSTLVAVICMALATSLYPVGIWLINEYFRISLDTLFSPISFSLLVCFLTFLGILLISYIVTYIVCLISFRKKNVKYKEVS